MKNEFRDCSSPDFVDRLSKDERVVYAAFIRAQSRPDNATLLLFQGYFGEVKSLTTPLDGRDSRLETFIDDSRQQNPTHYRYLLMALNLKRSFESQWRFRPGFFDETEEFFDAFVGEPLIAVRGLPDSPHNRFTLVQDNAAPEQKSAEKKRPALQLLQGGLTP